MQIKVIKKGENTNQERETDFFPAAEKSEKNNEKKVERTILDWVSDLRRKKNMEFTQSQMLLSNVR
jgi:hypothetical protein